jgi:hypothetical protein
LARKLQVKSGSWTPGQTITVIEIPPRDFYIHTQAGIYRHAYIGSIQAWTRTLGSLLRFKPKCLYLARLLPGLHVSLQKKVIILNIELRIRA